MKFKNESYSVNYLIENEDNKKSEEQNLCAQLPTLAVFLPWGSSEGAACSALTDRKSKNIFYFLSLKSKDIFDFLGCKRIKVIRAKNLNY